MNKEIQIIKWFFSFYVSKNRFDFFLFIIFSIFISVIEVLSIASVIPFLEIILSDEIIKNNTVIFNISEYFNLSTRKEQTVFFMMLFLSLLFFSSIAKIFHVIFINNIQRKVGSTLSNFMYESIVNSDYITITQKNSNEFLSLVTEKAELSKQSIFNILNIISSFILLTFLITFILSVTPNVSLKMFFVILIIFILIIILTKKILSKQSINQSESIFSRFKIVNETYGIIREIIIDNTQSLFKEKYKKADDKFRNAQFLIGIISGIPKFIIEYVLILIIFLFVFNLLFLQSYSSTQIIPIISSFAFVAYRSMPLFNNIYASIAQISGYKESVYEGIVLLKNFEIKNKKSNLITQENNLTFKSKLIVNKVTFKYPGKDKIVLNNLNLSFEKGKIYGIKGPSGTGKSTLLNIISGLIKPSKGNLIVDGLNINNNNVHLWRKKVSLVSQSNFFMDETIYENLKISSDIKDKEKLDSIIIKSVKSAALEEFVENLPNGYSTKIGDNAIRISGGQKQRLAIARALCKKPECLLLDESTSGIDLIKEKLLITNLKETHNEMLIIIVSHKKMTLDFCDEIIDLENLN